MTDEQLTMVDHGHMRSNAAMFTALEFAPTVIALHVDSREQFRRLKPVVDSCLSLLRMKPGWDSYGARPLDLHLVEAGLLLVSRLIRAGAPTPQVVPTNKGGLQFEWHDGGRELEVEVLTPSQLGVIYEDEATGEGFDGVVRYLGPILEHLEKLSAPR